MRAGSTRLPGRPGDPRRGRAFSGESPVAGNSRGEVRRSSQSHTESRIKATRFLPQVAITLSTYLPKGHALLSKGELRCLAQMAHSGPAKPLRTAQFLLAKVEEEILGILVELAS